MRTEDADPVAIATVSNRCLLVQVTLVAMHAIQSVLGVGLKNTQNGAREQR